MSKEDLMAGGEGYRMPQKGQCHLYTVPYIDRQFENQIYPKSYNLVLKSIKVFPKNLKIHT